MATASSLSLEASFADDIAERSVLIGAGGDLITLSSIDADERSEGAGGCLRPEVDKCDSASEASFDVEESLLLVVENFLTRLRVFPPEDVDGCIGSL